jgi:4-hydroxy-tetrahydrodipicolinate reductase
MVRLLQEKPKVDVVGVIDIDDSKIGVDAGMVAGLGEELSVIVKYPPKAILDRTEADIVLHATTAFMNEAYPQILELIEHRLNVITIAQELFFPLGINVERAKELDAKAKEMGVRISATGINPGFIMDIVPIVCSLPCWRIDKVFVRRHVDFSPYGPDEMQHIGVGQSVETFIQGVQEGTIGHIGLLETAAMVAHCVGLPIEELHQEKEPITTKKGRETPFVQIPPGAVCGFRQKVLGYHGGQQILHFQMVGLVAPDKEEDGVELGDYTRIYGEPNVDISIKEEVSQKGGLGTAAAAVNLIPRLLAAPPGFHRMFELTLPRHWTGGPTPQPIEHIVRY